MVESKKSMIEYLKNHYRYDTMHSWNNSTSYAKNIKIHNLGLKRELRDKCYAMLEVEEAFEEFNLILDNFKVRHNNYYSIGSNGRSGGYLVLYQEDGKGGVFIGRSMDQDEVFEDWSIEKLKARVELIKDFDKTCEKAVKSFIDFAKNKDVTDEEYQVTKTRKVAIPKVEQQTN